MTKNREPRFDASIDYTLKTHYLNPKTKEVKCQAAKPMYEKIQSSENPEEVTCGLCLKTFKRIFN